MARTSSKAGIPYKSYDGTVGFLTFEEAHSAGRTHGHLAYAVGMPLHEGNIHDRNINALAGRLSDGALMDFTRLGKSEVCARRCKLGFRQQLVWSAEDDAKMLAMTNSQAADAMNRTVYACRSRRALIRRRSLRIMRGK